MTNKPLAYLLGNQPFLEHKFMVNPDVLIPRPETEEMVELVIKKLKDQAKKLKILDIGTGSGVIAVSLAKYLKNVEIVATDICYAALRVAKENAQNLKVKSHIKFLQGNLFDPIDKEVFDVIISNPPYIPTTVIDTLDSSVRNYEPFEALDGGLDGLFFIYRILEESKHYLKEDGFLMMEIGYDQGEAAKKEAEKHFGDVKILKDLCKKDRFLEACKPLKPAKKA